VGSFAEPLDGKPDVIYKAMPKRIRFNFPVPRGYLGNLQVVLVNDAYEENVAVSLCSLTVVKVGINLPCVHLVNDVTKGFDEETKIVNG